MALKTIVALVGGVGGAKLAHGLAQILPPDRLTIIVNTGDDFTHYGLRVCPDLDTVMYTLSGLVDKANGWGIAGDTRAMLGAMQRYGEETWFGLGDQDVATHLLRTQWLRDGLTLTQVTARLASCLGIGARILPMANEPVPTIVTTLEHGDLEFQHYFVRYRWQPTVTAIRFEGAERAAMTPETERALASADAVLFAPSNPWLSIAPILAIPGMREALARRDVPKIAISPIIEGSAVKGPAAKLMAELGYTPSAESVAEYYSGVINGYVYDERDAGLRIATPRSVTMDTIMKSDADRAVLARAVLNWVESWN